MKKEATRITLDIRKLPEGYYVATSTDVQGLVAQGKTFEETVEIAEDLAVALLREQRKSNNREMDFADHIIYPLVVSV